MHLPFDPKFSQFHAVFFTARYEIAARFSQASVILFTGGGACVCGEAGCVVKVRHVWQGGHALQRGGQVW